MTQMINLTPIRKHKILSDYGIKDYYKYYKENGGILDSQAYSKVLRTIIYRMCQLTIENNYRYKLPARLGYVKVFRYKNKVKKTKDGKLHINYPPNWKATLELWENNPEAKERKQLVRYENSHTGGYTYKIKYKIQTANYKNKTIYCMHFNRQFDYMLRDYLNEYGAVERDE